MERGKAMRPFRLALLAGGLAVAGYAAYAAAAWARYGGRHPRGGDPRLDPYLPDPEVVERHRIRIAAPAETVDAVARMLDLQATRVVRAIFRTRELVLGGTPRRDIPRAFIPQMRALGWGVLADEPGRAIVMGAVTRPWEADVVFRALPPDGYAAFAEPGYVKIAWALLAEPDGPAACRFATETRVATTDGAARARFRRYWAAFSPGILLIRPLLLRQVRREAEARHRRGDR
jgi:hypothetical protein